jgi:hypothetical protein
MKTFQVNNELNHFILLWPRFTFIFYCQGSPFKCEISDDGETVGMAIRAPQETKQATANGDGLKEVALGAPAFFEIDTNGMDGLVDVKIVGKCSTLLNRRKCPPLS